LQGNNGSHNDIRSANDARGAESGNSSTDDEDRRAARGAANDRPDFEYDKEGEEDKLVTDMR